MQITYKGSMLGYLLKLNELYAVDCVSLSVADFANVVEDIMEDKMGYESGDDWIRIDGYAFSIHRSQFINDMSENAISVGFVL